jgi:hypothetical protein
VAVRSYDDFGRDSRRRRFFFAAGTPRHTLRLAIGGAGA